MSRFRLPLIALLPLIVGGMQDPLGPDLDFDLDPTPAADGSSPFAFEDSPGPGFPDIKATAALSVPCYEDYGRQAKRSGICEVAAGSSLPILRTFKVVTKPVEFALDEPLTVETKSYGQVRLLTMDMYYTGSQPKEMTFAAGTTLDLVWQHVSEHCIMRHGNEVFQLRCADLSGFTTAEGIRSEWWVWVLCEQGIRWIATEDLGDKVEITYLN